MTHTTPAASSATRSTAPVLAGCFTALVTPFDDGRIDLLSFDRLIDHQLEGGVQGLVLCGTTGESPTLSMTEQRTLIRRAVERAGDRCTIIAGTGTNDTAHSVALSKQARDAGVDAIMLVTPYYNKPTQQGLYEHFMRIVSTTDLPTILYNIPGRCGVEIAHDTLCRLAQDEPRIVAVKHATASIPGAARLRSDTRLTILSGDDPLTLPLIEVGASGVISVLSNLLPRQVRLLVEAARAGQPAATTFHDDLLPLAQGLLGLETNPIPIKTALAHAGLVREEFRLPMCPMAPAARARLIELLQPFGRS